MPASSRRKTPTLVAALVGALALLCAGAWVASARWRCTGALPGPPRDSLLPSPAPPASRDPLWGAAAGANVIICVLDAARADHLGCYGYPRDTTPVVDQLASQSLLFERHFCPCPHTKPSTASLLTSQHVDTHLALGAARMDGGTFTLERGFAGAGYQTGFFTSNAWASNAMGLAGQFDHVCVARRGAPSRGRAAHRERPGAAGRVQEIGADPEDLLQAFEEWLAAEPRPPFLTYLHLMPPHYPYVAPPQARLPFADSQPPRYQPGDFPFPEVRELGGPKSHERPGAHLVDEYDANLRYADSLVAQLLAILERAGVLENAVFVLTSDHGSAFGEHGYNWHPACPYDEALHIPLVVRLPAQARRTGRITALTSTVDILPTVYDLLGLPLPGAGIQGRSLLPLVSGRAEAVREYVFARTDGRHPCAVVRGESHALLLYQGGRLRALYDLEADPRQKRNIVGEEPERAERMAAAFREFALGQREPPLDFVDPDHAARSTSRGGVVEIDAETRRQLEALGYLR